VPSHVGHACKVEITAKTTQASPMKISMSSLSVVNSKYLSRSR
jgi:hypothetical protein